MELEGKCLVEDNLSDDSAQKLVFILGHGRSGTTLLNRVLSAHPQMGFISDEYNYFQWFWKNQSLYDRHASEKYWRMTKDLYSDPNISEVFDVLKEDCIGVGSYGDWLKKLMRRHCPGKAIGGIKIADFLDDNCEMIANEFKSAYCLHIVRDPRDVYLSVQKTPLGNRSSFYCGKSWHDSVSSIMLLKNRVEHYHEVRYEDLVAKPVETAIGICQWLGVDYSDRMMKFYEFVDGEIPPIHKLLRHDFVSDNFNKWQGVLSSREISYLHAGCGEKLFELGYGSSGENIEISLPIRITEYLTSKILLYRDLIKERRLFSHNNRRLKIRFLMRNYFT